jgi:transmembrane sensor
MRERLQVLFKKYGEGTLSAEEWIEWEQLLKEKSLEEDVYVLMEELWKKQGAGDGAFRKPLAGDRVMQLIRENAADAETGVKRARIIPWRKVLVAASVLFMISLAGIWMLRPSGPSKPNAGVKPVHPQLLEKGLPGGDRAMLRLADGTQIVLDTAHQGSLARQGEIQLLKNGDGQLSYLPSFQGTAIASESLLPNMISTPRGGQYRLVLSDGTKVWLNAATTLRFPAAFAGTERRVELSGEAYFEVEKDAARPFRVQLNDKSVVEVLGTHFNIMSYEEEGLSKTTLVEGLVKVSAGEETRVLKPGDQLVNRGAGAMQLKSQTNTGQVLAWKNGLFDFTTADLGSVARQLERWYGVEILFEGPVAQRHISGVISRNNHLDTVLKMLEFTAGVHSRREGDKLFFFL